MRSLAFLLPELPRAHMIHPAIEDHPGFIRRYDFTPSFAAARQYNPSLCRIGARLLMAWRVQDGRGFSRIVIARVSGKGWSLGRQVELAIPARPKSHLEDPRLVVIDGELFLFVAEVNYGGTFVFVQRCFVLAPDTFAIAREVPLPFGKNGLGTHEKNWMPFANARGRLSFVYQLAPEHVVIDSDSGEVHRSPGIGRWRWGTVSGRTPALRLPEPALAALPMACAAPAGEGAYVALVGGHQAHARRKSEYWIGAAVFSAAAPHRLLGVSSQPILWASERTPALVNPFDPAWNPLCIFPAGLVLEGDDLIASIGLNDSYCALMRWAVADLLRGLVPPATLTGAEQILAPAAAPAPVGTIRVRSRSRQPLGEHGGPFRQGDEWFTSRDRVDALGDRVEVLP